MLSLTKEITSPLRTPNIFEWLFMTEKSEPLQIIPKVFSFLIHLFNNYLLDIYHNLVTALRTEDTTWDEVRVLVLMELLPWTINRGMTNMYYGKK